MNLCGKKKRKEKKRNKQSTAILNPKTIGFVIHFFFMHIGKFKYILCTFIELETSVFLWMQGIPCLVEIRTGYSFQNRQ